MIGFIALAGIIVRNSILLVDYSRQEISRGVEIREAIVMACITRTRPIVITALALVVGSTAILMDPIFQGMAVSLMFGVLVSTLLTLIVIPLGCFSARRSFCEVMSEDHPDHKLCLEDDSEPKPKNSNLGASLGKILFTTYTIIVTSVQVIWWSLQGLYSLVIKPKKTPKKAPKKTSATVTKTAPTKTPEVKKSPAPAKSPEPEKSPEPVKSSEQIKSPEPVNSSEPVTSPESQKSTDKTATEKKNDSVNSSKAVKTAEPVSSPEPAKSPQPAKSPEAVSSSKQEDSKPVAKKKTAVKKKAVTTKKKTVAKKVAAKKVAAKKTIKKKNRRGIQLKGDLGES